jgi:FAD/FMN-containing dehydrogenase
MAVGRVIRLALVAALLLGAGSAPRTLQYWEYGGVHLQLNRVRLLTERLSKQNLLYQFRLAGEQRGSLVATAAQIDAAMVALIEGSPRLGVPAPATLEIRRQIEEMDSAWGALRSIAVASPFEYVRRAAERGASDPLGIRHFEQLASAIYRSAEAVSAEYIALCEQQSIQGCRAVATATASGMLSERLMKEFAFVIAGVDASTNTARLRKSRESLDRTLAAAGREESVQATMSPDRGKSGVVAASIWGEIQSSWQALRGDVDRVIGGEADAVVLDEALARQHALLRDLQRLSVAVRRFAATRRATGVEPPS